MIAFPLIKIKKIIKKKFKLKEIEATLYSSYFIYLNT